MGVYLHTHPRPLRCLHQPYAPWSLGLDSSPGAAAPHLGGDTPVGVLFLSRWPLGLCHHGLYTGSHAASESHIDKRQFYGILEISINHKLINMENSSLNKLMPLGRKENIFRE